MVIYLTQRDYKNLTNEIKQKEIRIKDLHVLLGEAAKKSGSFVASNPEYMALKSQIDTLESIVHSIKQLISKVEVKELDELDKNTVTNYSLVTVEDKNGEEQKYYIQIPFISLHNKKDTLTASPESPIGKLLLGAKVGQKLILEMPHNNKELVVKEIVKI